MSERESLFECVRRALSESRALINNADRYRLGMIRNISLDGTLERISEADEALAHLEIVFRAIETPHIAVPIEDEP